MGSKATPQELDSVRDQEFTLLLSRLIEREFELERVRRELENERSMHTRRMDTVTRSTTWRLTQPIRALGDGLKTTERRIRHALRRKTSTPITLRYLDKPERLRVA